MVLLMRLSHGKILSAHLHRSRDSLVHSQHEPIFIEYEISGSDERCECGDEQHRWCDAVENAGPKVECVLQTSRWSRSA